MCAARGEGAAAGSAAREGDPARAAPRRAAPHAGRCSLAARAHLLQLADLVRALARLPLQAVHLVSADRAARDRAQQLGALALKLGCAARGAARAYERPPQHGRVRHAPAALPAPPAAWQGAEAAGQAARAHRRGPCSAPAAGPTEPPPPCALPARLASPERPWLARGAESGPGGAIYASPRAHRPGVARELAGGTGRRAWLPLPL